jgi:hypothetical protein
MSPERISPIKAIRKTCLLCQGGSRKFVAECPDEACPLYPFRLGTRAAKPRARLLKAIRKFCLRCAGSAKAADTCTADIPMDGLAPCWLHPYRKGKMPAKKKAPRKATPRRRRNPERELSLPF